MPSTIIVAVVISLLAGVLPILSIAGCFWIIQDLRAVTIFVFLLWSSVALTWYFFYGRHHSALNRTEGTP